MEHQHWQYYLSLMRELEEIGHFIELNEDNYATYSIVLTRLLLAAGSEVDVVAKQLCHDRQPGTYGNIKEYQDALLKHIPQIIENKVSVVKYSLEFVPWHSWGSGDSPEWWKAYNDVKHSRHEQYREANLKNCLGALAGLCVLVGHFDIWVNTIPFEERPLMYLC